MRVPPRRQPIYGREAELAAAVAVAADFTNVLIVGAKGMGKSLFLTELLDDPWFAGHWVIRMRGSRVMTQERYGALRTAVSTTPRAMPVALPALDDVILDPLLLRTEAAAGVPVVIVVDDAHLLDVFTLDWLARVSAAELATLVLTSQPVSTATVTDASTRQILADLWSSWGGERIDLGVISREAAEEMTAALIGTESADYGWGRHLYWRSGGSPQLLRELAAEGIRNGEFRTPPPIQPPPLSPIPSGRVGEMMRPRLERLERHRLSELMVLASLGTVSLPQARELLSWEGVTELLDQGLALIDPLTGLFMANEVAASCAVELADRDDFAAASIRVVERVVGALNGRFDALPFTQLRFIAQSWLRPPEGYDPAEVFGPQTVRRVLLRAARASTLAGQPELGVECGRRLSERGEDFAATVELVQAYLALHQHDSAERVLTSLGRPTSLARGRILLRLHHTLLLWHRGDCDRAEAFLAGAATWFDSPSWQAETATMSLLIALLRLDGAAAQRLSAQVLANDAAAPVVRAAAASLAATTIALCGDVDQAERMLARHCDDDIPHSGADGLIVLCCQILIRLFTGAPRPRLGDRLYAAAQDALRRHDLDQLAAISWLSGLVLLRWGDEQEAATTSVNRYGVDSVAEGMRALLGAEYARALARHGELDRAETQLEYVDALGLYPHSELFAYLRERAGIEVLRARGERELGRVRALQAAERFRPLSPLLTSMLLYSAFRDGEPAAQVDEELEELARRSSAPVTRVVTRHVRAVVEGDAETLREVSQQLRALVGWSRAAAEADGHALAVAPRHEAERDAVPDAVLDAMPVPWRLDHRPARLAEEPPAEDALSQLSDREREIVVLAACGVTNTAIADKLFLSVRTVESHLYHARVKLGITGRESLAQLGVAGKQFRQASA